MVAETPHGAGFAHFGELDLNVVFDIDRPGRFPATTVGEARRPRVRTEAFTVRFRPGDAFRYAGSCPVPRRGGGAERLVGVVVVEAAAALDAKLALVDVLVQQFAGLLGHPVTRNGTSP